MLSWREIFATRCGTRHDDSRRGDPPVILGVGPRGEQTSPASGASSHRNADKHKRVDVVIAGVMLTFEFRAPFAER